jgi:oligopeptide transport system ATP-binding protein
MLLAAEPEGHKAPPPATAAAMLAGRDIQVAFHLSGGWFGSKNSSVLHAVDHVDITLHVQQTIGIVGESGSGKSTLARALLQLLPSTGEIRFDGQSIQGLRREQMRPLRRQLQIVFQDPFGSLSPRMNSGQIVSEGLLVHEPGLSAQQRDARAAIAFAEVELDPAWRNRYPHEFSGGQRQRIAIARAMILKPKVIVLDEPTSALDRSVQKQIINLLRNLQAEHGLAYLFISHDLAVVRAMADYIMVMKAGQVVEQGPTEAIFTTPQKDYTRLLLAAALSGKL